MKNSTTGASINLHLVQVQYQYLVAVEQTEQSVYIEMSLYGPK